MLWTELNFNFCSCFPNKRLNLLGIFLCFARVVVLVVCFNLNKRLNLKHKSPLFGEIKGFRLWVN